MTNEPVAVNGAISILLSLLTPVLAKWGIDADGAAKIAPLLGTLVAAAVAVWRVVAARSKVTPVPPVTPPAVPPAAV